MGKQLLQKLKWIVGASFLIIPLYLLLQRVQIFPVHVLSPSWIDNAIPFSSWAFWPYQSLYVYSVALLFMLDSKQKEKRFFRLYLLSAFFCFLFFFFWPTRIERPQWNDAFLLYQLFIEFEKDSNALPSMHVALAVISLYAAWSDLNYTWQKPLYLAWMGLILASTLLLKQHLFWDVPAGALVAALVAWLDVKFVKPKVLNMP